MTDLRWHDDARDPMAPSAEEDMDHLDWFIGKMREKYGMSNLYDSLKADWRDWIDCERNERLRQRDAERALEAKFDRMRRVAPKGTYIPPKLLKAKRRVVKETGEG